MLRIMAFVVLVLLMGCEATPVNNAGQIKTKVKLNQALNLPISIPVAYHVDRSEPPERNINFYGKLEEAAELVTNDMFTSAEQLNSESDFAYLIKLKAISDWDRMWGGWKSDFNIEIVDRTGLTLFKKAVEKKASGSGGLYDMNAVYNAFAGALKELLIEFLNKNQSSIAARANTAETEADVVNYKPVKELFDAIEPNRSGTGFFIDNRGTSLTAAHIVDECIFFEIQHKGQTYPAELVENSRLLDLAVLRVDYTNEQSIKIDKDANVSLGKQVFVTGYPLSGILADYPSLTVGNISSRGGLKGSKGYFQFSAPIQPGNSGGAITDYQGNLMGVVSSTLNQAMMLRESGTTSQNVNFGIDVNLLQKFLDKHEVSYNTGKNNSNFEQSSADAVEYSNQVLCYQ